MPWLSDKEKVGQYDMFGAEGFQQRLVVRTSSAISTSARSLRPQGFRDLSQQGEEMISRNLEHCGVRVPPRAE